jgi:hypothetical protein
LSCLSKLLLCNQPAPDELSVPCQKARAGLAGWVEANGEPYLDYGTNKLEKVVGDLGIGRQWVDLVTPCLASGDQIATQSAGTRVREHDVCWATSRQQVHAYHGPSLRQEEEPKVQIRGRGGREFRNIWNLARQWSKPRILLRKYCACGMIIAAFSSQPMMDSSASNMTIPWLMTVWTSRDQAWCLSSGRPMRRVRVQMLQPRRIPCDKFRTRMKCT